MSILFLIPARGGSKGIPNKNIIKILGKPLIGYTIEECVKVQLMFDSEICVSTDSEEIKHVAETYAINVPFLRPTDISTDTSSSEAVILHAIKWYENNGKSFDTIVLLQPTSPLRKSAHILEAIILYNKLLSEDAIDMVVSVKKSQANPYFNLFQENEKGFLVKSINSSFTRRQDCPETYEYNGAIYVINTQSFLDKGFLKLNRIQKYIMSEISSVDIDEPDDLALCEFFLQREINKTKDIAKQ